jgi:hypothetical protein
MALLRVLQVNLIPLEGNRSEADDADRIIRTVFVLPAEIGVSGFLDHLTASFLGTPSTFKGYGGLTILSLPSRLAGFLKYVCHQSDRVQTRFDELGIIFPWHRAQNLVLSMRKE